MVKLVFAQTLRPSTDNLDEERIDIAMYLPEAMCHDWLAVAVAYLCTEHGSMSNYDCNPHVYTSGRMQPQDRPQAVTTDRPGLDV